MDYQMFVKNLFNDLYVYFNGREALGLDVLQDTYQDEPLFLALIGGLDEALKISYNDAMKEGYAFYKRYCARKLSDEDWSQIVEDIKKYNQKWENPWCKRVILALLDLLEKENKQWTQELQEMASEAEESQEMRPAA